MGTRAWLHSVGSSLELLSKLAHSHHVEKMRGLRRAKQTAFQSAVTMRHHHRFVNGQSAAPLKCRVRASVITGSPSPSGNTLPADMKYYRASSIFILVLLSAEMAAADSTNTDPYAQTSIRLTEANNGSSIKIRVGTNVNIFLKTSSEDLYKSACYW